MSTIRVLFVLLAVVFPALCRAQTTVTLQQGLNGYTGAADARIACCTYANTNFGSAQDMSLIPENSVAGLLRFNIFQSEGGPVPNGATITSATLSLYKYWSTGGTFKATRILKNWSESAVTWNNTGAGAPWATPGVFSGDILATPDGQGTVGDAGNTCLVTSNWPPACWLHIDVTSGVQAFASGTANYGWKLAYIAGSGPNDNDGKEFVTRESTSLPGQRPQLTITYTTGPSCGSGTLRPYDGTPISGNPIAIAATGSTVFEAENFNCGGEGTAYHDNVAGNAGGQYRPGESVDIITSPDPAGGGYVVNNFETREWLTYSINVAAAGTYDIAVKAANHLAAAGFHIEIDNIDLSGRVTVPVTQAWSDFQWFTASAIPLSAGVHVLKLVSDLQYFDVNQLRLTFVSSTQTCSGPYNGAPVNGQPISIAGSGPTIIEAEYFDCGGEGKGYHDNVAGNAGGQFRTAEDVDIITSADVAGGGYVINNFESYEWLKYTISVPTAGNYDIAIRAANNYGPASFHFEIGNIVTNTVTVPITGSWSTFNWYGVSGQFLAAGQYELKLVVDQQYFDVNQIRFTFASAPTDCSAPPLRPYTTVSSAGFSISTTVTTPIEAELFNCGGESVAYHDSTPGNAGAVFRPNENVDIISSTDQSTGGYVINNFDTSEWLTYNINIATAGDYKFGIRASNNLATTAAAFHIEVGNSAGTTVLGSMAVPMTNSWDNFSDFINDTPVTLQPGTYTVKLVADHQYFNVDKLLVVPPGVTPGGGTGGGTGSSNPPELLFWSGFEAGTTLDAIHPHDDTNRDPWDCYGHGCWQLLSGKDNTTGFRWDDPAKPIYGGTHVFQFINDNAPAPYQTPDNVRRWMFSELRPGQGRNGSTALYQEVDTYNGSSSSSQGGGSTQNTFHITQFSSDPRDLYISFWARLQCDLTAKLSSPGNSWGRMFFEIKSADVQDIGPDFRYQVKIEYGGTNAPGIDTTKPYFLVIADNYYPGDPRGGPAPMPNWDRVYVPNTGATAVPLGPGCPADAPWFKFEAYWHRSSGDDGRFWSAVNGVQIANHVGPNMGVLNHPIDRIMRPNLYSGTPYPIYNWIDDMQIWSTFPPACTFGDPQKPWCEEIYATH